MTFAQQRNHLTTHFSESTSVVKRRVLYNSNASQAHISVLLRV